MIRRITIICITVLLVFSLMVSCDISQDNNRTEYKKLELIKLTPLERCTNKCGFTKCKDKCDDLFGGGP